MSKKEFYEGLSVLENIVSDYIKKAENPLKLLEIGAKEFVKDLSKLTKPYSEIKKADYTHLLDTFSYKKTKNDIEVGWGKYYGPMVEGGTAKTKAHPHLRPTFENNKQKYYTKMIDEFYK